MPEVAEKQRAGTDKLAKRFWSKVDRRDADKCWIWTGGVGRSGYGLFWDGDKVRTASRMAYLFAKSDPGLNRHWSALKEVAEMPTSKFSTRWPVTVEHECWKCVYDCEISGEINHGSKGDSITPGEDPFIESGSFKMLVCGITDHRFAGITTNADCTVILSCAVTREQAGAWVREQMRPHDVLDLQEKFIEQWERENAFRLR